MDELRSKSVTVKGLARADRDDWKELLREALEEAGPYLFDGCIDGGWMSDELVYSINAVVDEPGGGYSATGTCLYDEMINPGCADLVHGEARSADFRLTWSRCSEEIDFEIMGYHDEEDRDEDDDERDWDQEEWDYLNSPF